MKEPSFEWDERKDAENQAKHGIRSRWRKGKAIYERENEVHE
jgi:hypothetical protein